VRSKVRKNVVYEFTPDFWALCSTASRPTSEGDQNEEILDVHSYTVGFTLLAVASDHRPLALKAALKGINETPPIATESTGFFVATPNSDGTFNFILTFNGLTSAVVSHIHFGLSKEAGGVMIFLCGGGGQPACPAVTPGTVTGTFGAANVVVQPLRELLSAT
jgi:CHRD domain